VEMAVNGLRLKNQLGKRERVDVPDFLPRPIMANKHG
jgi:hypothetical protein